MESHAHSYRRSALASSACNRETISPSGFSRSHESQDVQRHPRLDMPGAEPDIGGPSLARNRPLTYAAKSVWPVQRLNELVEFDFARTGQRQSPMSARPGRDLAATSIPEWHRYTPWGIVTTSPTAKERPDVQPGCLQSLQ